MGVWIRWTGTMEWNGGMDWTGMVEWNGMERWNDRGPVSTRIIHGSSLNRIASHVNNVLVVLVRGAHA